MRNDSIDRQVLLALLAWQNQFISPQALVDAFAACGRDDVQQLDRWLTDNGQLTEDQRLLLSALVDRLISEHGDPRASIAALSSMPESLRRDLFSVAGSDVAATISLVPHKTSAESPASSATIDPSTHRFRIVRPHARGGLGEVFVAEDRELHREVALKEIQSRFASDADRRARFLLEAEITGGLEHPGIVPVYGLGSYADGRPFYAMRFVRGNSLQEAVNEYHRQWSHRDPSSRRLELRKLIGRFVDVCDAMAYAHSRGVLHRDLKPGNIMLGKYGETLVVDWGLAKPASARADDGGGEALLEPESASGSAATLQGAAVGTPAFMSPEQAAGDTDRLGPASDVYSLGATLFAILTGRPAFQGSDVKKVLDHVQRGQFAPPRSLNPAIPRPLNSICLKAMARDPEQRYADPRALADDLERWMADESVVAHRESFSERIARVSRRYRAATQAAAVTLVLITVVSLIALLIVNRALSREQAALAAEKTARGEADRALKSETAALMATQAALDAERVARSQARQTVDNYVRVVNDSDLLQDARWQPLRQRLLSDALRYYQDLVAQSEDKPDDQFELAVALLEIGRINQNTGSVQQAIDSYSRAQNVLESLDDQSAEVLDQLAKATHNRGTTLFQTGQPEPAREQWQRSLEIREQLVAKHPQQASYAVDRASVISNIAIGHMREGRHETAIEMLTTVAKDLEAFSGPADDQEVRRQLVSLYSNLGAIYGSMRELDKNLVWTEKARELYQEMLNNEPDSEDLQSGLASSIYNLSFVYSKQGERSKALEALMQARDLQQALVEKSPHSSAHRFFFARTLQNLGGGLYEDGQEELGKATVARSRDLFRDLVRENPQAVEYQNDLTVALMTLAAIADREGDLALRNDCRREAIEVQRQLVTDNPEAIEYRWRLADSLEELARSLPDEDSEEAHQLYQSAAGYMDLAIERLPSVPEFRSLKARCLSKVGYFRSQDPELGDSFPPFIEAAELLEELLLSDPENLEHLVNLAATLNNHANVLVEREEVAAADTALQRAEAAGRKALELNPEEALAREYLGKTFRIQARVLRQQNQLKAAAEKTLKRRELYPEDPQELYDMAREVALCIPQPDAESVLDDDDLAWKQECVELVVQLIRDAAEHGFNDWDFVRSDEYLQPLEDHQEFQQWLSDR